MPWFPKVVHVDAHRINYENVVDSFAHCSHMARYKPIRCLLHTIDCLQAANRRRAALVVIRRDDCHRESIVVQIEWLAVYKNAITRYAEEPLFRLRSITHSKLSRNDLVIHPNNINWLKLLMQGPPLGIAVSATLVRIVVLASTVYMLEVLHVVHLAVV